MFPLVSRIEAVEDALYSAYAARQVSTILAPNNEYQVILELEPQYQMNPSALSLLYVRSQQGALVPLNAIATLTQGVGPLTVNLHVKDFCIKRLKHNMGFIIEGSPAGDGMMDLPWLLEQLGDRCRSAILEQWTPPEIKLEDTLVKEDEWAKKSISFLKKWIK